MMLRYVDYYCLSLLLLLITFERPFFFTLLEGEQEVLGAVGPEEGVIIVFSAGGLASGHPLLKKTRQS